MIPQASETCDPSSAREIIHYRRTDQPPTRQSTDMNDDTEVTAAAIPILESGGSPEVKGFWGCLFRSFPLSL